MSFGLGKLQLSQSPAGASAIDWRASGGGLKPGSQASLFNITAGGPAIETVTVDTMGKATFTTVKKPGEKYEIEGIGHFYVDDQVSQV